MENKSFAQYKIIRRLGSGGMASVYLAEDSVLDRKVALKLLPMEYKSDTTLKARFLREAKAAAGLSHPNIITVFEIGEAEGQPFIAMEHIDGPTIDQLIKNEKQLSIGESVRIICRVLDTLETAHQKQIFHRDIKPGNIMLDHAKRVRVIDFGIAKGNADPNLTQAGTAFGTPAYMAPEQFTGETESNTAQVDIYACGISFYYMMCGVLPFEGDNPYLIRDAKLKGEFPKPSSLNSNISPALEAELLKSLSRNPKDRHVSAEAMIAAIEQSVMSDPTVIIPTISGPKLSQSDIETKFIDTSGSTVKTDKQTGATKFKLPKPLIAGIVALAVTVISFLTIQPLKDFTCSSFGFNCPETNTASNPTGSDSTATIQQDTITNNISKDTVTTEVQQPIEKDVVTPPPPVTIADGTIALTVNKASAFYIDGKTAGVNTTSINTKYPPGTYNLKIDNDASIEKSITDKLTVRSNQTFNKAYTFTFDTVSTAGLTIVSPGYSSQVFINGQIDEEFGTPHRYTLPNGNHSIKIYNSLLDKTMSKDVVLEKGKEYTLVFLLETDKIDFAEDSE